MRKLFQYTFLIMSLLLAISQSYASSQINDRAALADLKVGQAVFLIDISDPKKMKLYLQVIQGTFKGMQDQGVTPDFVMVYIGPSVQYLSTSPNARIEEQHGALLMEIESNVKSLRNWALSRKSVPLQPMYSASITKPCCPSLT